MTGPQCVPQPGWWPLAPLLAEDVVRWIESGPEPAAQWLLLTGVLGRSGSDRAVVTARDAVLADAGTLALVDRLPDWEAGEPFSGHDSPRFAPNLLSLLADMGLRRGDFARVDRLLDRMLAHQEASSRFPSCAPRRAGEPAAWGALLCDSHAILETLVRYGHGEDDRVRAGLQRMIEDLVDTDQGRAWPCRPDDRNGFRGPGRKADFCPQVTVEALRTAGRLPDLADRPEVLGAGRVLLGAWTDRGASKPYMFGHGKAFKTVKWPPTWYRVDAVLDAVSRLPGLWSDVGVDSPDRRAVVELLACLLAYNVDAAGRVTPRSAFRGFEGYSFGQKRVPSAFATARLLAVLRPFRALASEVEAVDVTALTSSKGGAGVAVPP